MWHQGIRLKIPTTDIEEQNIFGKISFYFCEIWANKDVIIIYFKFYCLLKSKSYLWYCVIENISYPMLTLLNCIIYNCYRGTA